MISPLSLSNYLCNGNKNVVLIFRLNYFEIILMIVGG